MKKLLAWIALFVCFTADAQQDLPIFDKELEKNYEKDWLVFPVTTKGQVYKSEDGKDITLFNGLVKRTFRIQPNVVCIDYRNMVNNQQLLRAVKPEAEITINGTVYNIGGLYGQTENAYLVSSWLNNFSVHENDFHFVSYAITGIKPFLQWKPTGWAMNPQQPTGKTLSFTYHSSLASLNNIIVKVNYELYDGIPLIVKWISIENKTGCNITIGKVVNEELALVEEESAVVGTPEEIKKQHGIYVETNYAFNNAMRYDISDQTTHWKTDSVYASQVNYNYQTPCLLEVYPEKVTAVELKAGEVFKSVRTHELLMDSYDRNEEVCT